MNRPPRTVDGPLPPGTRAARCCADGGGHRWVRWPPPFGWGRRQDAGGAESAEPKPDLASGYPMESGPKKMESWPVSPVPLP